MNKHGDDLSNFKPWFDLRQDYFAAPKGSDSSSSEKSSSSDSEADDDEEDTASVWVSDDMSRWTASKFASHCNISFQEFEVLQSENGRIAGFTKRDRFETGTELRIPVQATDPISLHSRVHSPVAWWCGGPTGGPESADAVPPNKPYVGRCSHPERPKKEGGAGIVPGVLLKPFLTTFLAV
jgi:hypothetical protein